ncbi:MAG TPA: ATP-grasp domain-containing protein [Alkalispirochaeta sp.]|nr:ATP-grasp domain-containing protein [Alkalispirochaeta sp.]
MVHEPDKLYDIGIVGGGQLGLMLVQAAIPLGLRAAVLDPDPDCPAAMVAPVIPGELTDTDALSALVSQSSVTTFEIEHTNPTHLITLEQSGARFAPSPQVLSLISDKLGQKVFFRDGGVPVPPILSYDPSGTHAGPEPVIQKTRFGGYDGRGVARVAPGEQFALEGPSFVEQAIPIVHEIAVVLAMSASGELALWDPVMMEFHPQLHLVSHVATPADLSPDTMKRARTIASDAARLLQPLGFSGILAVELFVDSHGTVLLNEVAPRPHNSGHVTMESSRCSQFEQHLRCVAGLPLGDTSALGPAAMVNLLGPSGGHGRYTVAGVDEALKLNDVHLHVYGKRLTRPGRKLGHVTARAIDTATAIQNAHRAAAAIRFEPIPTAHNEQRK